MGDVDMNLGQLLLRQGLLSEEDLADALSEHERSGLPLAQVVVRLGLVKEDALVGALGAQQQSKAKKGVGEMLLEQGCITQEQLDKALMTQKMTGKRLGQTLVDLKFMPEERLVESLANQFDVPRVKLDTFDIDDDAGMYLPEDLCRENKIVPLFVTKSEDEFHRERKTLTIAVADPTNMHIMDIVKFKSRMEVKSVVASEADVVKTIDRVFLMALKRSKAKKLDQIARFNDSKMIEVKMSKAEEISYLQGLVREAEFWESKDKYEGYYLAVRTRLNRLLSEV